MFVLATVAIPAAMTVPPLLSWAPVVVVYLPLVAVAVALCFSGVREKLAQFQAQAISALQAEVTSLRGRIGDFEERIAGLEQQKSDDAAEIAALHGKVARLESEVAALRQSLSAKEAELAAVKTHRDSLQSERDSLRQRLIHAEAELAHAQSELARAEMGRDAPPQQGPRMQVVVPPQQPRIETSDDPRPSAERARPGETPS